MPKRSADSREAHEDSAAAHKTEHQDLESMYSKIATEENARAVDENPPLEGLLTAMKNGLTDEKKGRSVVYWMRMEDMRIFDNRAASYASDQAQTDGVPLIVLFVISPQDYKAHDRGPRRIDFMLRNLAVLKNVLDKLNIPLYTTTVTPRRQIPEHVIELAKQWGATRLYGNISYELDELRRDTKTVEVGKNKGVRCEFVQDKLVVNPNTLKTKTGNGYAVYSPWQRQWLEKLNQNLDWLDEAPEPTANQKSIRSDKKFSVLFDSEVPQSIKGFECDDKEKMEKYWPAGTEVAKQVLDKFLHTKAQAEQMTDCPAVAEESQNDDKKSRIKQYADDRGRCDLDTSSRLSPYLASGVISARALVRATMKLLNRKSVEATRDNSVGKWVQEVAWRDFYNHVLVSFPRVSMGRPYLEKFASVKWESNMEHLEAWKKGETGVPIVDAAMRQLLEYGWMHNRCRMTVAMYLTKDLMIDWRHGERFFMQQLIDGDLASNNGGWQWSASTGTDPQPYFRIFNPYNQSEKADPNGDYIRHYIPQLKKIKGNEIHHPSKDAAAAHKYPKPIVEHNKETRDRAIRRYQNPGAA